MTCKGSCNQGRDCTCQPDKSANQIKVDKTTLVVATLLLIFTLSMVFGLYELIIESVSKGQECEVTVRFKDSSATYIGRTV